MGGDNPDNCYRLVGIEHTGRYRLTVTPRNAEPASTTFTLVANYGTSKTVQTLDADHAVRDADGGFQIDIHADPPGRGKTICAPHRKPNSFSYATALATGTAKHPTPSASSG
ncbi:MAG: hypothetical protein WDN04_03205 [Rhodospirillales bacterium]